MENIGGDLCNDLVSNQIYKLMEVFDICQCGLLLAGGWSAASEPADFCLMSKHGFSPEMQFFFNCVWG